MQGQNNVRWTIVKCDFLYVQGKVKFDFLVIEGNSNINY